ncbi:MAG: shikimate kinase [Pseudoflavonifractor sp.]|nr:shikimate kinase [Alloprevotella sp.]MCM1117391.1 shikimate kinase [Pseudoflavonifractor sp.]
MKPIFLIGYMGCGKSTLGRGLGAATGLPFIDLDNYIEARFHRNIRDIFAERGEEGFRLIEQKMLHEVGEFSDVIIACGGGTPCFFDNMDYMNAAGTTVFLDTSIDKLHTRLMRGRHKRPLIANKNSEELREFIIEALDKRMPHYSKAAHRFKSDLLDTEVEAAQTVERFIELFNLNPTRP